MSIATLASLGMAIGAPLVYADQAYSIYRKQDARGFSHDVCAVLLIANITRCFFWLGERFEFALLLQSVLMIVSQLGLLHLCIRFRPVTANSKSISSDGSRVVFQAPDDEGLLPTSAPPSSSQQPAAPAQPSSHDDDADDEAYPNKQPLLSTLGLQWGRKSAYGMVNSTDPHSSAGPRAAASGSNTAPSTQHALLSALKPGHGRRPLDFWQWQDYDSYLYFLGFYVALQGVLYLIFGSSTTFIATLGYLALGMESTLPIPQLVANYRRKSLAGFRPSVLVGWLGGDSFKLLYFLLKQSPAQFTTCAVFQLSIDLCILAQSYLYRKKTEEDEDAMRVKAAAKRRTAHANAGTQDEVEEDDEQEHLFGHNTTHSSQRPASEPQEHPHHVIQIEADESDEGDLANAGRKPRR